MAVVSAFQEVLNRPTMGDVVVELMVLMLPVWVGVLVGVLVGWAWKPKWAKMNMHLLEIKGDSNKSMVRISRFAASLRLQAPFCNYRVSDLGAEKENSSLCSSVSSGDCSSVKLENENENVKLVNEYDLKQLHRLVEESDGGPAWIPMMDKSTANMRYQAWRRDPEMGPPQYRSRTVYEDATPEMLRDFFWDDEFRLKWDDMLLHAETLEECPTTGTMVVQWVRKFPFFCSDREYVIGRRIWECDRTFYCISKGVPWSSLPHRNKLRRVDLYYSSWCIRVAESERDGRLTACEVLLFHHEDMGIPWEIAKLGIRKGMWGAVKKIDPGLRAYQQHRASGAPLSHSAYMAQINTKVGVDSLDTAPESTVNMTDAEPVVAVDKPPGRGIPKLLIIVGAVAIACSLDRGLLTKGFVFGVARRFARTSGSL